MGWAGRRCLKHAAQPEIAMGFAGACSGKGRVELSNAIAIKQMTMKHVKASDPTQERLLLA